VVCLKVHFVLQIVCSKSQLPLPEYPNPTFYFKKTKQVSDFVIW